MTKLEFPNLCAPLASCEMIFALGTEVGVIFYHKRCPTLSLTLLKWSPTIANLVVEFLATYKDFLVRSEHIQRGSKIGP